MIAFCLAQADQLLPIAALLVDREQMLGSLQVVGVELEDLLECLDRFGLVREPFEVKVRDLQKDRDLAVAMGRDRWHLPQARRDRRLRWHGVWIGTAGQP